jgi:hypothetical protein
MFARFDLSALSRHRSAKFTLALFIAIVVITLVIFTARTRRNKNLSAAKQDAVAAQLTPTPNANTYIWRGLLRSRLRGAFNVLGDRLEKPGKERLTFVGTLRRQNNPRAIPFRLFLEFPHRMRLEEQGAQPRVIGFDGSNGWVLGATPSDTDQEMIEIFVFDSVDHFFLGQVQGFATRALGSRFRLDDGIVANYTGPFYDIYQVTDHIAIGSAVREQAKLFYIDSDSQLLERVRYKIKRGIEEVNVEVRMAGWRKVGEQQVPGTIIREENGNQALTLTINTAIVGPRIADGIFNAQ